MLPGRKNTYVEDLLPGTLIKQLRQRLKQEASRCVVTEVQNIK